MAKKKTKPIEHQMEIATPVVADEPEQKETKTGVVFGCKYLNVRKEPKPDAAIIAMIHSDTVVEIEGESGGFYGVTTPDNIKGFCMKKYIKTP